MRRRIAPFHLPGFLETFLCLIALPMVILAGLVTFSYLKEMAEKAVVTYVAPRPVRQILGTANTATYLFFGDIMLGRNVENSMNENGDEHPFLDLQAIMDRATDELGTRWSEPVYMIGNLEGPILTQHVQTPSMGFQFSFKTKVAEVLRRMGFTHLSVANNHSRDWGPEGEDETVLHLNRANIVPMVHASSTTIGRVQIITADDVMRRVNTAQLCELIDPQLFSVLFIHWGEEYVRTPNVRQREIASVLSDCGIDAIIGHHPHVTQTIATGQTSASPIFYSLGNFIFDQYFSNDVKRGLVVGMRIDGDKVTFITLPVLGERMNPRLMTTTEFDELQPCERTECLFYREIKN